MPDHPIVIHRSATEELTNCISTKRLDDEEYSIVIALDITGIKVTNRGQWMQ